MRWDDRTGRRLKPRDLHVFAVVAAQGNMSRAADVLAISRPVVSRTITEMEAMLGVPLFDRSPQGVEPTIYGEALLKRSVAIFDELRQGMEDLVALADPTAGKLRLGFAEVMAAGFGAAVLNRLSLRRPNLALETVLGDSGMLVQALRERRCELVLGRVWDDEIVDDLDVEPLFHERLLVVVGQSNPLASRPPPSLADLVDEPWILSTQEWKPGVPVYEAFAALGCSPPKVRMVTNSINLRTSLLPEGRFITVMPSSLLHYGPPRPSLAVLPITLPLWSVPAALISLKHRTLSPMAQQFAATVREILVEKPPYT
ncbi:LysR family transcriptional regulator [Phreatobacter sp. AB_2022a]|uniref:LysR family transcriptional regulator n=1 Tax=Phreatobacter sp. AB_2022a TaxID=3003134 RepID=UPI002287671E|nr:LysR family transcriptional regulator [Phreatobacter sp. AB_2022a]MCZ0737746.1 LysR family transcriptional regulator [Phreatobacter sp. AB_2022a]